WASVAFMTSSRNATGATSIIRLPAEVRLFPSALGLLPRHSHSEVSDEPSVNSPRISEFRKGQGEYTTIAASSMTAAAASDSARLDRNQTRCTGRRSRAVARVNAETP